MIAKTDFLRVIAFTDKNWIGLSEPMGLLAPETLALVPGKSAADKTAMMAHTLGLDKLRPVAGERQVRTGALEVEIRSDADNDWFVAVAACSGK